MIDLYQVNFFYRIFHQMGKRSGNKYRNNHQKGQKKVHVEWSTTSIPQDNELFREYYRLQLKLSEEEFKQFWATMKQKLPVVFRVNPTFPNYKSFCNKLNDQNFTKNLILQSQQKMCEQKAAQKKQTQQNQPTQIPKIQLLKWYPGDVVYSINTNKQQFKKSKLLGQLHKYLQKSFDAGLISRQQLVSMLPPLYLDIQPDDVVLDMCAAPGSKTSQLLQMINGEANVLGKGCVVANDADYSRSQMLIHQINRSGTASVAVINHPGQFLPELYTHKINHIKEKFQFDKILCDVPCSGDGATRKIPVKWANWHTSDGIVLHPLQLSIVMKSLNLLKRGGLLVYSTCSLSPMEDQAVLHALFQKVNKGLQIIDIHNMYGIKGRRGLLNWKVCGINHLQQKDEKGVSKRQLRIYQNYEQAKINPKIKDTLFPPASQQEAIKIGLQNSMRILPHDQNSGGFFIALLKKHQDFEWKYDVKGDKKNQDNLDFQQKFVAQNLPQMDKSVVLDNQDPKQKKAVSQQSQQQGQSQNQNEKAQQQKEITQGKHQKTQQKKQKRSRKSKGSKYQTFLNIQDSQFDLIQQFYGLNQNFRKLLYVRQNGTSKRKVNLVSQGIRSFLQADTASRIKLVNMGCKVLEKGKESFSGHQCLYRLCQEGIHFIFPYMEKRKVKVSLAFFKKVLSTHSLTHQQIEDLQARQKIRTLTQGSLVIYIEEVIHGQKVVDAMVGQNFKNSFHIMVSKEDVASLNIRYL